jgi:hypothetical protein
MLARSESLSMKIRHLKSGIAPYTWLIAPTLVIIAFVFAEVLRNANNIAIGNLDYFPLVDRAVQLSFSSWDGWVNWIHPVGFPWFVRLGLELGVNAARWGQALSILGGVLGLIGTYAIAWSVTGRHGFAVVCQIFCASAGYYLFFGSVEGNDMLGAGLQILSLGLLIVGLTKSTREEAPRARWVVAAALFAGLAYLTRYTGLITALVCLVVLIGLAVWRRRRSFVKMAGLYVLIFVVVTAVQWIPSWIVKGSPLSNDQGQNVWFHVYQKSDFLTQWPQGPSGITVAQVFFMNPGKFISHWWNNFQSFWVSPTLTLVEEPLKLFALAGLAVLLLTGTAVRIRVRVLIGLFVVAHIAALSLLRLDPRFLIIMIPLLTIGAVYLFWRILPEKWRIGRSVIPVQLIALLVGLLFVFKMPLGFAGTPVKVEPDIIAASDVLHTAGMKNAREVYSTDLRLQDLQSVSRARFAQANDSRLPHDSLASLLDTLRQRQFRFVIYDASAGPRIYPDLAALLKPETHPTGLTPLYIQPDRTFAIYRLENSSELSPTQPVAQLEQNIALQDYSVTVSRPASATLDSRDLGVLLQWRADRPVASSYKVFVHVVDDSGQVIAQDDSIPAIWTYPTNAWPAGALIGDFHRIRLPSIEANKSYTLMVGLYDEATGARLNRLDSAGKIIDDKIVLPLMQLTAVTP